MRARIVVLSAAVIASATTIAACGMSGNQSMMVDLKSLRAQANNATPTPDDSQSWHMNMDDDDAHGMMHQLDDNEGSEPSASTDEDTKISGLTAAEQDFLSQMIPHHQQAVDMATLAITRSNSPDVINLASSILSEQSEEITTMKTWLGGSPMMHMHGDGMLSMTQMSQLRAASGSAFDRLFLAGMIQHHAGAIAMAKLQTAAPNPTIADFAKAIIKTQTAEVVTMNNLLKRV